MTYAFENLTEVVRGVDWSDDSCTPQKAYLMSLFAALAYEHVPTYEIGHSRRAQVMPALAYEERLRQARTVNRVVLQQYLRDALGPAELAGEQVQVEFVDTILGVYAIVRLRTLIVIAARGSLYAYDWKINFNTSKYSLDPTRGYFHAGFYVEADKIIPELVDALDRMGVRSGIDAPPIYLTGHSLGGAVAAILHALWTKPVSFPYHSLPQEGIQIIGYFGHSAYAFGMPKFCDVEARRRIRSAYHFSNRFDLVPTLPPARYGFVAHPENPVTLDSDSSAGDPVKAAVLYAASRVLGRVRLYDNHKVERYWKRLAAYNGIEIPLALLPPDDKLYH